MDKTPRPLDEPVLSRAQWGYDIVVGVLTTIATLLVLHFFADWDNALVAGSMAVVVFSLMNIALAVGARSATQTALDRDTIAGRRQLVLYGLALLFTVLSTELGILQRILNTTSLTGGQWLVCIVLAVTLVLLSELIKLGLRRRRSSAIVDPQRSGARTS
jgi:Ca2+-transporting ATPase